MTEQVRLAEALADTHRNKDQWHRLLRWWGFRGFTVGLEPFLDHLIVMESTCHALAREFGDMAMAWDQLLCAREVKARLQAVMEAGANAASTGDAGPIAARSFDTRRPTLLRADGSAPVPAPGESDRIVGYGLPVPIDPPAAQESQPGLLMYAASWTLVRCWDGYVDRLDTDALNGLAVAEEFACNAHFPGLWASVPVSHDGTSLTTLSDCIDHIKSVLRSDADGELLPRLDRESDYDSFQSLLRRTCFVDGKPALVDAPLRQQGKSVSAGEVAEDADADEDVRRWGNRPSTELSFRELLPEWKYALEDQQRRALALLQRTPEIGSATRASRQSDLAHSAAGHVLFGALSCSKTIEKAAALRLLRLHPDEEMARLALPADVLILQDAPGASNRPHIYRLPPTYATSRLVLSVQTDMRWPSRCVDFEIHELFALPPSELIEPARKVVAHSLRRTVKQADLCVKHALAREMFAFNANRAVIHYVCAEPHQEEAPQAPGIDNTAAQTVDAERTSLHHYMSSRSVCIQNAYSSALCVLAATIDAVAFEPETCTEEQACMVIPAAHMTRVVAYLVAKVEDRSGGDRFAHHRALAIYSGALLAATTGHRVSRQLLHFLFALDEKELVTFVADKMDIGSEARFVGVPKLLADVLIEYCRSVTWLIGRTRLSNPALADEMEVAVGSAPPSAPRGRYAVGALFAVQDGALVSVSSRMVDVELKDAASACGVPPEIEISTRALRRNLITFMANRGASGHLLELQLGHNGDQHLFGAASHWVPLDQLVETRALVQRYAATNNWVSVRASWVPEGLKPQHLLLPAFARSDEAFEGRSVSHDEARRRVRIAIREAIAAEELEQDKVIVINQATVVRIQRSLVAKAKGDAELQQTMKDQFDEFLSDWRSEDTFVLRPEQVLDPLRHEQATGTDGVASRDAQTDARVLVCRAISDTITPERLAQEARLIINGEVVRRIKARLDKLLPGDRLAQQKAMSELSAMGQGWRRSGGYVVTASSVNLARFTPGPVTVDFGRHLAIARHVLSELPGTIADYVGRPRVTSAQRLAVVAVLLVACDAVLNPVELPGLIEALQAGGTREFEGNLQLRARIVGTTAIYDRTVDLTSKSAAAVLGYLGCGPADPTVPIGDVLREADDLASRLNERRSAFGLAQLAIVMRPFWHLRMPGSTYAACIGEVETTAPSEASMSLLLGGAAPPLVLPEPRQRDLEPQGDLEIRRAVRTTRQLLRDASNLVESRTANSGAQRNNLREAFREKLSPELVFLSARVSIVALFVSFIEYLVEVGGTRVKTLRFGTLVNYQSRALAKTYQAGWDKNLLDLDHAGLDSYYAQILGGLSGLQRSRVATVLRHFHRYLRAWHGAGACSQFPAGVRTLRTARSVLLPWTVIGDAVSRAEGIMGPLARVGAGAAGLLAVNSSRGLRTTEGYGIRHHDFVGRDKRVLRVAANPARSIKTFGRLVPIDAGGPMLRQVIDTRTKQTVVRAGSGENGWLFVDPANLEQNLPKREIVQLASWSLKHASGDALATLYSGRHGFASAVKLAIEMPNAVASPIAQVVAKSLAIPQGELGGLKPSAAHYPFMLDRLGLWMGHRGVDMLHSVYSHVAWTAAGEYCARQAEKDVWHDGAMAALLGIHRTTFYRRKVEAATPGAEPGVACAQAVRALVKAFEPAGRIGPLVTVWAVPKESEIPDRNGSDFLIEMADALLLLRADSDGDRDQLVEAAVDCTGLRIDDVRSFYDTYVWLVDESKFFDFEPGGYSNGRNARRGVLGTNVRRREFLARVAQRASESDEFRRHSIDIASRWAESVDGYRPVLISRSDTELDKDLQWLREMGYRCDEIRVNCRTCPEGLHARLRAEGHDVVIHSRVLGRHATRADAAWQSGLEIVSSARNPRAWDFHRVLLALAVTVKAGLPIASESPNE